MRTLPLALPLFLLPMAAAAQAPGTAGEKRPRLEVLQALPEQQLFPLMNLIATSLGVGCDHCHVQATPDLSKTPSNVGGWVWDADDKLPKRRAREMMKMVVDINASRFRGETKVTCYTCHRGATRPDRLPPLPPPSAPAGARTAAATPLPPVERVLANYVAAVGKADQPVGTGTIMRGWDERSEGRYGKFEVIVGPGDRYRLVLTVPEATTTQGMDSVVAWAMANGQSRVFNAPADLARMRRIAMRYRDVKEQPANMRVVGVERVGDRDSYVLQARLDSITTQRSYFDAVTGLLRRELVTTETVLIPLETQVDYEDYRDVNGVQLPFRIRVSTGAPYDTSTRTILEILRNVPVSDSLFKPPAGSR